MESSDRTSNDEQRYYTCGRCKNKVYYLKIEKRPDECPECGYIGIEKSETVPSEIKIPLNG